MADEVLTAPLVLEYPFTRTTGPVIGGFLTGLREGVIHGVRRSDGTVMCPPLEYDPITAAPLSELVAVGTVGTVTTWTWNGEPRAQQPFAQPFAWAMITLDGADTPMLHAVFVDSADDMATGMRVEVVWRENVRATSPTSPASSRPSPPPPASLRRCRATSSRSSRCEPRSGWSTPTRRVGRCRSTCGR